jgi:3-oxoacyl-[acyl-carrier protein] reductase
MDLGLSGRVALITGAGRGIGAAVARSLAGEGCAVALLDRRQTDGLHDVAAEIGRTAAVHVVTADVRETERANQVVAGVVTTLGRLDILVCCAGITRDGISWKLTEQDWDDVIDVDLKGCFNYCRAAASALRAAGSGRIVNVSSINGLRGKVGQANYAAAKAGMVGLSRTLARELGRWGTTVNVVAPGLVDTPLTSGLPAHVAETALAETVLGRVAQAQDIADAVVFLCSSRARHITGAVLRVDGGQYM